MKGDREDGGGGDFLSLGSTSDGQREREGLSGGQGGQESAGASASAGVADESSYRTVLSSLSRNGLSMLAGGANGGFSLKPPAIGNLNGGPGLHPSFRNLSLSRGSERASTVSGGGFTGFTGHRASLPKTSLGSLPGMGLRFGSEETKLREEAGASPSPRGGSGGIVDKAEQPLKTDVQNLSRDECWRLILKLGTRWPAWNGASASQATQGVLKEKSSAFEASDRGHRPQNDECVPGGKPDPLQLGQKALRLLASRALEALAQTPPDHFGRAPGGMLAPKRTTQEILDTKPVGDATILPPKSTQPTSAVSQQPTSVAKASNSSREMPAPKTTQTGPRTAALTIFYDGTVNVCNNVPADKARLIMMFAEKAGVARYAPTKGVAISSGASPLASPTPVLTPSETARPQEDPQHSKPCSQVAMLPGSSSVLPDQAPSANHVEDSSSYEGPAESSDLGTTTPAEPPPVAVKITVASESNLRQQKQQVMAKPLPNARKNSLARFLDSRKRSRGQCSEGTPSKKPSLGDGCQGDADDVKGSGKSPTSGLCSQSSISSKDGIADFDRTADEMMDSLTK